ncbi:hypothetical protein LTR27_010170 [Elasticomyces elasticus]|nr:hypothetical protein LTR27_010170 [Elasticomyces elasticus]
MAGGAPNGYFPSSGPVAIQPAPSINNHHFNGDYCSETANQPGQYFRNSHYAAAQTPGSTAAFSVPPTPGSITMGSVPPTPGSLAGRKRSRGDIYAEVDEESDRLDGSATESSMRRPFELNHTKRPSVSSRKSMRKDPTTNPSASDQLGHLLLPSEMRSATTEPLIDEATRALGISWTRMDATEALTIQRGGYSKWISKHYPRLKDVEVWFENTAIPGYLVEARNDYSGQRGYYIFSNDLMEARLVTAEPGDLVPRLRLLPKLHLAAPGGHIRAEMETVAVARDEVGAKQMDGVAGSDVRDDGGEGGVVSMSEANGMYAAHEMELD